MKKTLSLVLVIILSLALLSACAPSSTDTSTDTINEDNEGLSLPNLTVVNKEHSYYTTIKDSDIEYIGNDFPSERGTYIKLIDTASEFEACVDNYDIDKSIFEDNYVLALNIHLSFTLYTWRLLGCHNLKCEDGEYSIDLDYYSQNEGNGKAYPDGDEEVNSVKYYLIPKSEANSFEGIKSVKINTKPTVDPNYIMPCRYVDYRTAPPSSQNAYAWLVTKENKEQIAETVGVCDYDIRSNRLLIYLPFEPQGDIKLANLELKDNVLTVIFENYTHMDNVYLQENDVKYYSQDIMYAMNEEYIIDPNELSDGYEVNIIINVINVPYI